ncbi:hypothetical protein K504DRAFT_488280 [Pleomassaria siparia CBS 279.74]|uniref:ATPase inhibitor, mitochondrial n=1 Tax=Pleomassaria siparia CBS 279.74 TaxID=1314801 RepID=A0A6G1KNG9_9PLEO|nr:hypothetical protein K504DRAFT_488280 [Pleomassaria siparia CBS 279.74]
MFRTAITQAARPLAARRFISTTTRVMAGETGSGSSRPGGSRQGDAFSKREAAAEELYIRSEEKARLKAIKERLQQERKHIDALEKHIDEVTKDDGGQGEHPDAKST